MIEVSTIAELGFDERMIHSTLEDFEEIPKRRHFHQFPVNPAHNEELGFILTRVGPVFYCLHVGRLVPKLRHSPIWPQGV